jgi:riboflavin synthase
MFTGIVKQLGLVRQVEKAGSNVHFLIESPISNELKIDESVSHSGVCLTVTSVEGDCHSVTAIDETLKKTNLGLLKVGEEINLERAMSVNARLDGHIVQGHVDTTATCINIEDASGSWVFTFRYVPTEELILVNKGSICINGVSLTVVNPHEDIFSVAIIPYTYEHTTFKNITKGDVVNLEFDVIGKYVARYMAAWRK